jgi:hypothetical protein
MAKPTKDPGVIRFQAAIVQSDNVGASAWVIFPYDLKELYVIGNLVPVIITFDGFEYRGSIAKMGGPDARLLIKKEIRARIGKQPGDKIDVSVTLDDKPRSVEVPAELAGLLKNNPRATAAYDSLSFSHKKEYAEWIAAGKQAETRSRRAEKAFTMLLDKQANV